MTNRVNFQFWPVTKWDQMSYWLNKIKRTLLHKWDKLQKRKKKWNKLQKRGKKNYTILINAILIYTLFFSFQNYPLTINTILIYKLFFFPKLPLNYRYKVIRDQIGMFWNVLSMSNMIDISWNFKNIDYILPFII